MTELTAEIEAALKEYTTLQKEEHELKERKQALQEKLKSHLRDGGDTVWNPEIEGVRLKVRFRSTSNVEYDEETLRRRLGDRYRTLLEPDIKKLRTELPNLEKELAPLLDRIGGLSPEKVKTAIKNGSVSAEEFKGAFTKSVKEYISVSSLPKHET